MLFNRARLPLLMHRQTGRERERDRDKHALAHTHTHTKVCTMDPQEKIPQRFDIKFAAGMCGGWYVWGPVCVGMFDKVCVCIFVGAPTCLCVCLCDWLVFLSMCICCCCLLLQYLLQRYPVYLCVSVGWSVNMCAYLLHPATCPPQTNNIIVKH